MRQRAEIYCVTPEFKLGECCRPSTYHRRYNHVLETREMLVLNFIQKYTNDLILSKYKLFEYLAFFIYSLLSDTTKNLIMKESGRAAWPCEL